MPPEVPPSLFLLWPQLRGLLQLWVWGLLPEPPQAPQVPPLQTPEVWLLQPALGGLRVLRRGERSVLWGRLLLKWTLGQEEPTRGQQVDKHFLLLRHLLLGLPQLLRVWVKPLSSDPGNTYSLGPGAPNSLPNPFIHLLFICVESLRIPKHRPRVPLQLLFWHKPAWCETIKLEICIPSCLNWYFYSYIIFLILCTQLLVPLMPQYLQTLFKFAACAANAPYSKTTNLLIQSLIQEPTLHLVAMILPSPPVCDSP